MDHLTPWNTAHDYDVLSVQNMYTQDPSVDDVIIFVHGNGRDAEDWRPYFDAFFDAGVDKDRLWAISFDNSTMTHNALARQLEDFVKNLFTWTGATTCSIIGHSLGVTVSRVWMERYDRYTNVETFVGLAGANHGVTTCPPQSVVSLLPDSHKYKPCQMIGSSVFTPSEIETLNETVGETPGNVDYYTVRGTDDVFFVGDIDSPKLEGATNYKVQLGHDEVRESPKVIKKVCSWVR